MDSEVIDFQITRPPDISDSMEIRGNWVISREAQQRFKNSIKKTESHYEESEEYNEF